MNKLTTKSFLSFDRFHVAQERSIMEKSLDTFLKIYDANQKKINKSIKNPKNESSKIFLVAIRFLRNFKGHFRRLELKEPGIETKLYREIMGLMASILQVIMNAKNVPDADKHHLRQIFLGKNLYKCMNETQQAINAHFVYAFPSRFTKKKWIQGNWFTHKIAKKTTAFFSRHIDNDIHEFVARCFVTLYETDLRADFGDAAQNLAVKRLQNMPKEHKDEEIKALQQRLEELTKEQMNA